MRDFYREGIDPNKFRVLRNDLLLTPILPKDIYDPETGMFAQGLEDDARKRKITKSAMVFLVVKVGPNVTIPVQEKDLVVVDGSSLEVVEPKGLYLICEDIDVRGILEE